MAVFRGGAGVRERWRGAVRSQRIDLPVLYSPAPASMWHVLSLIVWFFEILVGLFCILTATMLYPNEEGKIQSKLEDLWVRLDDYRHSVISRYVIFLQQVAGLEAYALDEIFGRELFSGQSYSISFWFSLVSIMVASLFQHDPVFRSHAFGDLKIGRAHV